MTTTQMIIAIIIACVLALIAFAALINRLNYSFFVIDRMSGARFEKFIARLYGKLGYKSKRTSATGDQGIDVIVKKGFKKIGIQAKRYNGRVGNSAVQEAAAGKKYYKLDKVCVITNSGFTKSAIELARANGVQLIDREGLKELIKKARKNN